MVLVALLAVVCLASASLSATSVLCNWGRYAMKSVRRKRPANKLTMDSWGGSTTAMSIGLKGNYHALYGRARVAKNVRGVPSAA